MARTAFYHQSKRVNILIEAALHEAGAAKAKSLDLRGGFSEYVGRLIAADRAKKGRRLLSASHRVGKRGVA